eukprot:CAMPEP_0175143246 /NCGR_PEP_ID=MMETSP0087-20121206/13309_1 /TAXON_ID=136419 /ORGANISM="Unknown Unknown, Strain D1" /LENGTH=1017 /DNA_ID=CAMNT_0016427261 /DNA_START=271 /DNA_END=3324 /DNA_ORIENTATION=+
MSMIGSLYIMMHILQSSSRPLALRQKLIFVLAGLDFWSSLFFFLSSYTVNAEERGIPIQGVQQPLSSNCQIQAMFLQLFNMGSVIWGACIAHNLYAAIVQRQSNDSLQRHWKKYTMGTSVVCLFFAVLLYAMGKYGDNDYCCWIKRSSSRIYGFLVQVFFSLVFNTYALVAVKGAMNKRVQESEVAGGDRDAQLITLRFLEYIAVFTIVWSACALNRFMGMIFNFQEAGLKYFWHILLEVLFVPTRGMFNAVVYSNILEPVVEKCVTAPVVEESENSKDDEEEEKKQDEDVTFHDISVFCSTYNMGEKDIDEKQLAEWLPKGKDIYAIGCQECMFPEQTKAKIKDYLEIASGGVDKRALIESLQKINVPTAKKGKGKGKNIDKEYLKEIFDMFDDDGSGDIDKEEFGKLLVETGFKAPKDELAKLWNSIDLDQSGSIDFQEFYDLINGTSEGIWKGYEVMLGSDNTRLGYHGYIVLFLFVKTQWVKEKIFKPRKLNVVCARGIDLLVTTAANKGAAGMSFDVYNTSLAFFTCHMRSDKKGANRYEDRNQDARGILKDLDINVDEIGFDAHQTTHHFFLFGDFNYRTVLPAEEAIPRLVKAFSTDTESDWWDLLTYDEMNIARKQAKIFYDFEEAEIHFPPSFRRNRNQAGFIADYRDEAQVRAGYSCKVKESDGRITDRSPSWTDRLVWHSLADLKDNVRCTRYDQVESLRISDHNPVVIELDVKCMELPKALDKRELFDVTISDIKFLPHDEQRELPFTRDFRDIPNTSPPLNSKNFVGDKRESNVPQPMWQKEQLDKVSELVVHFPILCEDPIEKTRKLEAVAAAIRGAEVKSSTYTIPWNKFCEKNKIHLPEVELVWFRGMHMLLKFLTSEVSEKTEDISDDEDGGQKSKRKKSKKKGGDKQKDKKKKKKKGEAVVKERLCQVCLCLADFDVGPKKRTLKPFSEVLTIGGREVGVLTGMIQVKPRLTEDGIDDLHKEYEEAVRDLEKIKTENQALRNARDDGIGMQAVTWHDDY